MRQAYCLAAPYSCLMACPCQLVLADSNCLPHSHAALCWALGPPRLLLLRELILPSLRRNPPVACVGRNLWACIAVITARSGHVGTRQTAQLSAVLPLPMPACKPPFPPPTPWPGISRFTRPTPNPHALPPTHRAQLPPTATTSRRCCGSCGRRWTAWGPAARGGGGC